MKTTLFTTVVFAFAVFATSFAQADILYASGDHSDMMIAKVSVNGSTVNTYTGGNGITNSAGQSFNIFCTDINTKTTSEMYNPEIGQAYGPVALRDSTYHSEIQKTRLQSLFDHVYTTIFDAEGTLQNATSATLLQLAIWEIVHENPNNSLSYTDGDIKLTNLYENNWNPVQGNNILGTLDGWFAALNNNFWDETDYVFNPVSVTVYLAEGGTNVSQTMIGVNPYDIPSEGQDTTPEPATMLIFGLGIAGLGIVRRRMISK